MRKKIVVGCIGAAAILVLVSFTSLVGTQAAQTSHQSNSPLFAHSIDKTLGKEQNVAITPNYLGKDTTRIISFPIRDARAALLQKVIGTVNNMDDETFNKFVNFITDKLRLSSTINDDELVKISKALKDLKNTPTNIQNLLLYQKTVKALTITFDCPTIDPTLICLLTGVIGVILLLLELFIELPFELAHKLTFFQC